MLRGIFGWVRRDPVIATLFFSLVIIWILLIGLGVFWLVNNNSNPVLSQNTPTMIVSPTKKVVTVAPTITPFPDTPLSNQGRDIAPPAPTFKTVVVSVTPTLRR